MRKTRLVTALIVGLLLPIGCGGGGDDGISNLVQQLRGCTEDGLGYLFGLTLFMGPIVDAIENDGEHDTVGLTVNEVNSDTNVWSFNYEIDLDGDGTAETTLAGQIDFSEDPSDGIADNATAAVSWSIDGSEDLTGAGTFDFLYKPSGTTSISGGGFLNIPGDCFVEFDIPEGTPLDFDPNANFLTTDVLGAEIYGVIELFIELGDNTIFSILTLSMDSNTVTASGVEIDDVEAGSFSFDVDLDIEALQQLLNGCAQGHFLLLGAAIEDIGDVVAALAFGEDFAGENLSSNPTGLLQWSFTATWIDRTMTGTLGVTGGLTPGSTVSLAVTF